MKQRLMNRGPDDHGQWFSPNHSIGITHTRLSILDLSSRAAQPMISADQKTVISFNGEIYNYLELRQSLMDKGYRFYTESDTEVMLVLYREYGISMLTRLRGMFSFALWDENESLLFCARDLYGIKPMYYSDDGSTLRLASQVRALLATDIASREHDVAGIAGFYLFGHVPEPYTIYRSIRALPAGSSLCVTANSIPKIEKFDSITGVFRRTVFKYGANSQPIKDVEEQLRESAKYHLISDVPIGLYLSSGIDSGLLLWLLNQVCDRPVQTFTLVFDDDRQEPESEAPMAAQVAAACGSPHQIVRVETAEAGSFLPDFIDAMDQPSIDGLNTWLISRAVSNCGLKVAISGIGGDELFGGYPSFKHVPRWVSVFSRTGKIPGLNRTIGSLLFAMQAGGRFMSPKAAALPTLARSWSGAYLARRGLFMPSDLPEIMGPERAREGLNSLNPLNLISRELDFEPENNHVRIAILESSLYLRNQLLRDADWAAMSHSVEVRTPWVDRNLLLELAPVLNTSQSVQNKVQLAGRIFHAKPAGWTERKKHGFTVPVSRWMSAVDEFDTWKRIPMLRKEFCPGMRRWAYAVMSKHVDQLT